MDSLRQAFNSGKTKVIPYRLKQLENMQRMVQENRDSFLRAISMDLRKPNHEATLYELDIVSNELIFNIKNCAKWAQHELLPKNLLAALDAAYTRKQPYGVVLVLGAWNYPILLTLQPLIGNFFAN